MCALTTGPRTDAAVSAAVRVLRGGACLRSRGLDAASAGCATDTAVYPARFECRGESTLFDLDQALDRSGEGALEARSYHDTHHRVVERAYLLFEPRVLIFWHGPKRRFQVFVGDAGFLAQLGGSPDE